MVDACQTNTRLAALLDVTGASRGTRVVWMDSTNLQKIADVFGIDGYWPQPLGDTQLVADEDGAVYLSITSGTDNRVLRLELRWSDDLQKYVTHVAFNVANPGGVPKTVGGGRLTLDGGQVISTRDGARIGDVGPGTPFVQSGEILVIASGWELRVFNLDTLEERVSIPLSGVPREVILTAQQTLVVFEDGINERRIAEYDLDGTLLEYGALDLDAAKVVVGSGILWVQIGAQFWAAWREIVRFDFFGHAPAPRGWVQASGGPLRNNRPR